MSERPVPNEAPQAPTPPEEEFKIGPGLIVVGVLMLVLGILLGIASASKALIR